MTISGVDLSRWQAGLTIDQVRAAGHRFVNIQLTKGVTAPNPSAIRWGQDATAAGLARIGYHWLDASASGAAQWNACKARALAVFGGLTGWGLQVDCEDNATRTHLAEFATAARADLGRPLVLYTGDWWIDPRGWGQLQGAEIPYLWAVPNVGWLPAAPDELSPHWRWAGSNGWSHLSLLQWSAAQKIGGIAVSSTIVRSPEVLCALTGQHIEV